MSSFFPLRAFVIFERIFLLSARLGHAWLMMNLPNKAAADIYKLLILIYKLLMFLCVNVWVNR